MKHIKSRALHTALAIISTALLCASCAKAQPASSSAGQTQPASAGSETGKKPNIVFFLVDNVGWGDFSVYGGPTPTPRIDRLANEGIRFNNYNVECECMQSRTAIMTGRHPVRCGT